MTVEERWAAGRGGRIHYLDSADAAGRHLVPVICIPGMLGTADDYRREMASLAPRRCVAISLRGRGRSEAPQVGYRFEDHVADIEAVVEQARLAGVCLMAYSLGVPMAIGYADRHPHALAGLILGDYPPSYRALPPDWPERAASALPPERVRLDVARAIQRESREILLWAAMSRITCPTLILRGGRSDALLQDEDAAKYRQYLPAAEVVVLDAAGHRLWEPEYEKYIGVIRGFLAKVDAGRGRDLDVSPAS